MTIERALSIHLPSIVAIYNEAIEKGFATAHMTAFTLDEKRDWFDNHDELHPVFVVLDDGRVAAWYSLRSYREGREAFAGVREISYYVLHGLKRKGIGALMLSHAVKTASELGVEHLLAIVLEKNLPSIALLKKFVFSQWGLLPDLANFNGERCGHLYFGLKIED